MRPKAHHTKTVVVDFDDTLAFTLNRDWKNARPNDALIQKLNGLYRDGWDIHIVTARGQLSCNGDSFAADMKYRWQMEEWLKLNGVLYTSLSFEKKLAAYYIDDKGVTPDQFLSAEQQVLEGGSGAKIVYDSLSNSVIKTDKNTPQVIEWYRYAARHWNVPEIYSVVGDTIKMERLYPFVGDIQSIINVTNEFKNNEPLQGIAQNLRNADLYPERCVDRIAARLPEAGIPFQKIADALREVTRKKLPGSFGHGDLSLDNVMTDKFGQLVYLIDPINDPFLWQSHWNDKAKLAVSYELKHDPETYKETRIKTMNFGFIHRAANLNILMIGHLCRIYPYAEDRGDNKLCVKIINRLKEKSNVL